MRSLVRVGLCAGVIGLVGIVTPAHVYAQCSAGGTVSNVNDCVVPIRLINGQFVSPGGADAFACAPTWSKGT